MDDTTSQTTPTLNPSTPFYLNPVFYVTLLGLISPLIEAKLGIKLNLPEIATLLVTILGFILHHGWTTNAHIQAQAQIIQAHVAAKAGTNAATAAAALAASPTATPKGS